MSTPSFVNRFAVFDVREVVHQANASRAGLVAIASVLALIHLGVAGLAAAACVRLQLEAALPHPLKVAFDGSRLFGQLG